MASVYVLEIDGWGEVGPAIDVTDAEGFADGTFTLTTAGTPPPVLASPDGEVCSELGERTTRPIRPTSLPVWRIRALLVPLRFRRRPPLCLPPPFLLLHSTSTIKRRNCWAV